MTADCYLARSAEQFSPFMNQNLTAEELEFFMQRLTVLGEAAHRTGRTQIVRLVNFYWKLAEKKQDEFQPQWRKAA